MMSQEVMCKDDDHRGSAVDYSMSGIEKFLQWTRLGWYDLIFSYRPSIVGPLWQTFTNALWAAGLAIIFWPMHGSQPTYIPYLVSGVVLWNFISSCITSGSRVFLGSAGIMLNMLTSNLLHVTRLWANLVFKFVFQFVIFIPLVYVFDLKVGLGWLEALAGFGIVSAIGYSTIIVSGLITTRYRDAEHLFSTLMRFLFFMTPIFWIPSESGNLRAYITAYNPFYYLIEIIRRPLIGQELLPSAWYVSLAVLLILSLCAFVGLRRYGKKIAGWL